MGLDASTARSLILNHRWDFDPNYAFTADSISDVVVDLAVQKKVLDRKPEAFGLIGLKIVVCDVVWELVLEGVLAPGSGSVYKSSRELPHLHFTEHGKR